MPKNTMGDWIVRHRLILLFSVIVILSIFLRFYDLGTKSIWLDEAESIKESSLTIQGIAAHSNQPPLYFLILRGWIHLFGISEIAIRSLSAIFGVCAVGLIFMVGRSIFNTRVALIGAFLTSFAFFPILHSQNARAYSLLLLLSLLSYWCFIEALKKNNIWWYLAYLIASLLMLYTHFYGLFIVTSQIILFFIFFKRYKIQRWKYLGTIAILLIALVPFALLLKNNIYSIASNGFWIPEPDINSIVSNLINFSGIGSPRYILLTIFILLAIFGFFAVNRLERYNSRRQLKKHKDNPVWQIRLESPEIICLLL
jgi:mannosyltransferase